MRNMRELEMVMNIVLIAHHVSLLVESFWERFSCSFKWLLHISLMFWAN